MNAEQFEKIRNQYKEKTLMNIEKLQALAGLAGSVRQVSGDVAECGVFRGGSLKFLSTLFPNKTVYGFDTFCGLLAPKEEDASSLKEGTFSCELKEVQKYVSDKENIKLIEGVFPNSIDQLPIEEKTKLTESKFCFVHLDMDQFEPTLAGLEYFYNKINPGGVLLCDGYLHKLCPGIQLAFKTFFKDKPELYFRVGVRQVCFIKNMNSFKC
jgi:hypothetical protein